MTLLEISRASLRPVIAFRQLVLSATDFKRFITIIVNFAGLLDTKWRPWYPVVFSVDNIEWNNPKFQSESQSIGTQCISYFQMFDSTHLEFILL